MITLLPPCLAIFEYDYFLEQNMKEEQSMADWIMANTQQMLDQLWPKIQASVMSR
jgi:hypothetical protein